jgi:hypothetical protein
MRAGVLSTVPTAPGVADASAPRDSLIGGDAFV